MNSNPQFIYLIHIATTTEKLWSALTEADFTRQYWGMDIESEWKAGSSVTYRVNGQITDEGVVIAMDPLRSLSYTFHPLYETLRHEPPSKVTFTIELVAAAHDAQRAVVQLTVTHENFLPDSQVFPAISTGWPVILSSLKTLLETGRPLITK